MLDTMKEVVISVFILSVVATIGGDDSASIKKRWQCTSAESQFTNSYCEAQGNIQGCYYLLHFSQYRSCASVCNDVLSDSLTDTARCNDFCPGYLSGYGNCLLVVTDSSTTVTDRPIEDKTPLSKAQTDAKQIGIEIPIGVALGIVVAAFAAFAAVFIYKRKCKKKSARDASASQTSTPLVGMRRSESAQGTTVSTQATYTAEPISDDRDSDKDYQNSFRPDAADAV